MIWEFQAYKMMLIYSLDKWFLDVCFLNRHGWLVQWAQRYAIFRHALRQACLHMFNKQAWQFCMTGV